MRTTRLIDGRLTSLMVWICSTMNRSMTTRSADRTSAPPTLNGRLSRRTMSLNASISCSKCGLPIVPMVQNLRSSNARKTSSRFSLRPESVVSTCNAVSNASLSYRKVFLFTTNTSRCSGSAVSEPSWTSDRAASVMARFAKEASEKQPPATKMTSAPMRMPNTLTKVLIAAMALLPPSQSMRSMCMSSGHSSASPAWPCWSLGRRSLTGTTTTSMPPSRFRIREARYDFPARPSPSKITG
mmetsp:Transcript_65251/g.199607  ORF Transcript_65251/g.199607 Transcript_65251/m.199607 type:complete len:241 (-) Transcript_65251:189-911(-)